MDGKGCAVGDREQSQFSDVLVMVAVSGNYVKEMHSLAVVVMSIHVQCVNVTVKLYFLSYYIHHNKM